MWSSGRLAEPRVARAEGRVAADDLQLDAIRLVEGAVERPEDVVAEAQRRGEAHVDAVAAEHLLRLDALRLAGEQAERAERIAADVEQRPAAERAHHPHVVGRLPRRRTTAHEAQLAERAARDDLGDPPALRRVAPRVGLHEDEPGRLGGVEERIDLLRPRVSGFSTRTCLPAASALCAHSTWSAFGSAM